MRRIFRDYLGGKGIVSIARELADEGVRTRRGSIPSNRWIRYILRNPVYIGKIRWSTDGKIDYVHGEETDKALLIDGNFPPIIDEETFQAVQAKLERRASALPYTRHDQPVEWMLKGLVRCSSCGSTLIYSNLACPSMQCYKYAHGSCSVSHSLSIAKANKITIAALESCVASNNFPLAPQAVKKADDGPDYDHLIAVERLKLRRVLEAYEAGIDTLEEYARKKARLNAGIEELLARKEEAEKAAASKTLKPEEMRKKVREVLDIIKSADATEEEKNAALRTILSHIVYEKAASRLSLFFIY